MKRWLRVGGIAISLAALGFFAAYAKDSLTGHDFRPLLNPGVIAATGLLTLFYAALIPITAIAWSRLLAGMGYPTPLRVTIPVLATTQFGKYLPGNVGHHLGRVLVSRSRGIRLGAVLTSMAYETVLVLLAGAHIGALTLLVDVPAAMRDWPAFQHRGLLFLCLTVAVALGLVVAPKLATLIHRMRDRAAAETSDAGIQAPRLSVLLTCYALYALNFLIVGLGLFAVAATVAPKTISPPLLTLLTGAFACSWVIGFIAPGAPAGLGVREALLVFWLHDAMGPTSSVTLIVVLRISTTVGDLLNFTWGSFRLSRMTPAPSRMP